MKPSVTVCLVRKDTGCSDEGRDEPFIELVDNLEVHPTGGPHVFIHQVEGRVGDELVQMAVVVFLSNKSHKSHFHFAYIQVMYLLLIKTSAECDIDNHIIAWEGVKCVDKEPDRRTWKIKGSV